MFYLPSLRRLLLPSVVCLLFIIIYRSSHRIPATYLSSLVVEQPIISPPADRISLSDLSTLPLIVQRPNGEIREPPIKLYYQYGTEKVIDPQADPRVEGNDTTESGPRYINPESNSYLRPLLVCPTERNTLTNHIRLPNPIRDISMVLTGESENEKRSFLNAAILSLPFWSENQYLLVSRVQTDGSLQLNIVCEANICYTDPSKARPGEKPCTEEDLFLLRGAEGMRCATPPMTLNVPPTPAASCGDGTGILMDVPGFHDPRIFWTGKGEPLMILNSQSRYACFGLWAIDLRLLHYPLRGLLSSNPLFPTLGPLMSYPYLTELTRNPPESRGSIEKNWMFFSTSTSNYIHYDLGPSVRTFAKLLGGGLTTPNMTDPREQPCLQEGAPSKKGENYGGSWHQGTNSLKLILCDRNDQSCRLKPENTVFWSLIHHKHKNYYQLPLRYERYFIVWASTPPFNMLAMSSHPILFANETAGGWDPEENWADDPENIQLLKDGYESKPNFATFTYSVSIAYSWGRHEDMPHEKNTGYLDDEVIIGLGVDDEAQYYTRAKVQDLLQCLRVCPPRAEKALDGSDDPNFKGHKKGGTAFNEHKFGGDEDVDNLGALGDIMKERARKKAEGLDTSREDELLRGAKPTTGTATTTAAATATKTVTKVEEPEDVESGAAMVHLADIPENLRAVYMATGELPKAFHDKNHEQRIPITEQQSFKKAAAAKLALEEVERAAKAADAAANAPEEKGKAAKAADAAANADKKPPGAPNPAAGELGAGTDVQGLAAGEVAGTADPLTVAGASKQAAAAEALGAPAAVAAAADAGNAAGAGAAAGAAKAGAPPHKVDEVEPAAGAAAAVPKPAGAGPGGLGIAGGAQGAGAAAIVAGAKVPVA